MSSIVSERAPGPAQRMSNCHIQHHPKSGKLPRYPKIAEAGLVSVAQLLLMLSLKQRSCKTVHLRLVLYKGSV